MKWVFGMLFLLGLTALFAFRFEPAQLILLGDRERLAGRLERASAFYESAANGAPGHWRPRARLAALAVAQGQVAEGAELYEKALALGPQEQEVLLPLADLRLKLGQFPAAQQLLRQSLAADPGRAETLALLARLELARGRVGEARRWCAHLLELNPASRVARQLLAVAAESEGKWRLAAAEYGQAVGTTLATDGAMRFNAAVCLVKAQDPAGALQQVRLALELNPRLLGAYLLAHDLSGDRRFLEALVRLAPSSPEAGVARSRL